MNIFNNEPQTNRSEDIQYKYNIRNIPQFHATQKTLYSFLVSIGFQHIITLKINYNRTALLVTSRSLKSNAQHHFQIAINDKNILLSELTLRPRQTAPKLPSFSVVIKNVDSDITINDIEENSKHLTIAKMWRITSCKTGKPTPLIGVTTHQKNTIDHLLIHGITLFGRTYYAEPFNPPTPTPVQCSRCFQFGHALADCPNKPICPKCSNSHNPNKCPEAILSCPFSQGNHPAWSRSCRKFKKLTVIDEILVLLTKIIEPNDDDDSDNISPIESILQAKAIIAFLSKTLLNLFPHQKSKVQTILEQSARAALNLRFKISHSGHKIHFTFN
ncbi:hypothetical protein BDFB_011562 [Asbolus verrucosus]|uniref:CCHC-type domain-containing protein n=1 Tax=Asbolus verrucosus TaxID=1661398 RepID=A0A482VXX0_ASBVE|nr:hypothetical protein BDFB_011562 [Asbolus verrucosus]